MSNEKQQDQHGIEEVEHVLTKAEQYIENNQKQLSIILGVIVIIVLGFLGFMKFVVNPAEVDAHNQMFVAEQYFAKDSFDLALNGDGNYMGFSEIIDEYGITKASNLAKYYAGISSLKIGEYQDAIDYLTSFKSKDILVSAIAVGATGDAYYGLEDTDKAISQYLKAADTNPNDLTSAIYLFKAGQLYQKTENYAKALEVFTSIKNKYPESTEGKKADKYIAAVNAKM